MYLDSAILVKLVVREPDSRYYADLLDGQPSVHTSELAIAECRSALLRKRGNGDISTRICDAAWGRLETMWSADGGLRLIPVSLSTIKEAGEVMSRCADSVPLRTLDAIHLATCLLACAYPLQTNDRIMRQAAGHLGIPLAPAPGAA
jgi:predicted nucleic acid-binding protein